MPQRGQSAASYPIVRQEEHFPRLPQAVIAVAKEFPAGTRTGPHRHERAQFLFAVQGVMIAHTSAGTWLVPRGHALWLPAGLQHDVSMHGRVSMRTVYVDPAATPTLNEVNVLKVGRLLEACLMSLATDPPNPRHAERAEHLSWVILDELARAPATLLALPLPDDPRLARIARALLADAGSPRTLDDWCAEAGVSRRTLTRGFRTETGISFGAWRRRLRLVEAATRLANGEPLARVAARLDYQSVAAFRAMARREFGEDLAVFGLPSSSAGKVASRSGAP